jgi:hypothetical protein
MTEKFQKIHNDKLEYKPSPYLLSSLIKYQTKKFKVDDLSPEILWSQKIINEKEFRKLNNFFWFFSLDLKSSKIQHKLLFITGSKIIINIILRVGNLILQLRE